MVLNKPLSVPFRSGTSSPKDLVMDERATPIAAVSPAVSLTSLPEPGSIQSETGKRYPMVRTAVWNKIAKTLKHQVSQLYKGKNSKFSQSENAQELSTTL